MSGLREREERDAILLAMNQARYLGAGTPLDEPGITEIGKLKILKAVTQDVVLTTPPLQIIARAALRAQGLISFVRGEVELDWS